MAQERGLPAAGGTTKDAHLFAGNIDIEILEIMLTGTSHFDGLEFFKCFFDRADRYPGRKFFWEAVNPCTDIWKGNGMEFHVVGNSNWICIGTSQQPFLSEITTLPYRSNCVDYKIGR